MTELNESEMDSVNGGFNLGNLCNPNPIQVPDMFFRWKKTWKDLIILKNTNPIQEPDMLPLWKQRLKPITEPFYE